jgi:hypothetical protein
MNQANPDGQDEWFVRDDQALKGFRECVEL